MLSLWVSYIVGMVIGNLQPLVMPLMTKMTFGKQ